MKSIIQKSMVLALSTLLLSETLQAAQAGNVIRPQNHPARQNPQVAPFTGSAKAAGGIKTNVKRALAAYQNPAQPDLNALQQLMTDAQSIRPGVTNGYTQKEWDSLKVEVYTKTGVNLEADPARMDFVFNTLIATLQRNNGQPIDRLANNTVQGAQNFQAAWQGFLALGGNGNLFQNAQQEASDILHISIDQLRTSRTSQDTQIENLQHELDDCYQTSRSYLNVLTEIKDAATAFPDFANTIEEKNLLNLSQSLTKDMQSVSRKLKANGKDKTDTDNVMQTLKDLNTSLQNQLEAKNSSAVNLQKDLTQSQQQLEACLAQNPKSLNAMQQTQIADLEKELEEKQAELDACLKNDQNQIIQTQEARIKQLNQENTRLTQENQELTQAMQATADHMAQLTAQLQAAQQHIANKDQLQKDLAAAQAEIEKYKKEKPRQ